MSAQESCCGGMFWVYLMVCLGLVMFAGLMSGLTLGLMSLSLVDLEVLRKAGTPTDQINAAKILPVVKNQHLLLCTLLIGNSLAMEALPIFLDALLPAWGAILISVTLILAFGEIIPQAVCSRYGLSVGARLAGVVRILLLVFFPVAYPISKLLDWLLGKGHFALMRRAELKTLVDMHGNEAGKGGELTHDETTIITGALDLTQKTAKDSMTEIADTFALDINSKLDMVYEDLPLYDILNEFQKGHSHMAVVIKRTKDIGASSDKSKSNIIENRMNQYKKNVPADGTPGDGSHVALADHLGVTLNASPLYSSVSGIHSPLKRSNMEKQYVRTQPKKSERGRHDNILDVNSDSFPSYSLDEEVIGIITMENVIEELLQEDILDETDEYVDVHNKIKINMQPPRKRSSSRSPEPTSVSQFPRRNPTESPLSPYHQSSILRSPVSPYAQAPVPTPTILSSPGKSFPSSPTNHIVIGSSSPTSHRVSRKLYEKLQKNGESNV
ncbi:DUF21 domain-containing protein [Ananas comosus]|uniref:DUF21 domain-containing protein n=1 Tax=Ananas comosus TaxID=4615 RepID=A0A199VFY4_ANACO|nr:DUF21 domain-containing protein [Ananas comosus]